MKAIEKAEAAVSKLAEKHHDKFIDPWQWKPEQLKPVAVFTIVGGVAVNVHLNKSREDAREYVREQKAQENKHQFFGTPSYAIRSVAEPSAVKWMAQANKALAEAEQARTPEKAARTRSRGQKPFQYDMGF